MQKWRNVLIAFNVLNCFAIFLIVLVLIPPLFCKPIHRRIQWYSHMLSWLIVAIALLLTIGHQEESNPPAGLCFVQSALLYATPPLTTFSMACYLLDINLAITSLLNPRSRLRKSKAGISILLASIPWFVFFGVIIEVSIMFSFAKGTFKPSGHKHFHPFCHYNSRVTNIISSTLVGIAAIILIVVKVWTAVFLLRKLRSSELNMKLFQMVLSPFVRSMIFTGLALIGVIIGQLTCTIKSLDAGLTLALPLIPIIAAAVYGIHMDVLRCAMFWRKKSKPEDNEPPQQNTPKDEEETWDLPQTQTKSGTLDVTKLESQEAEAPSSSSKP